MKFRTLQTQNSPGRWAQEPCPAREQPKSPALEGSRHRIRLRRVHSHSHGEEVVCVVKRGARKSPGAVSALGFGFAGVFCRVCRLHGAVFLPFSGVSSPESMFVPSYQNSFVFSSENQQKRAVVTEMHKMFEIRMVIYMVIYRRKRLGSCEIMQ